MFLVALRKFMAKVALESTIITHGMPYPQNVETALSVEAIVREGGAEPVTIGVIHGKPIIGMSPPQIEYIGQEGMRAMKLSRRDLPIASIKNANGSTTVAATIFLAEQNHIALFATGGIGGVHRGAEETFDISADLIALQNSSVGVVCSGCKSILDVPKTIEMLETLGIPIVGYQTMTLPLFYCRESSFPVDLVCNTPLEIARFMKRKWEMGLPGAVLIVNPPPEEFALDPQVHSEAIEEAVDSAKKLRISGKELTPFLLSKMGELTLGKSLLANIALIKSNAKLAAEIAVEFERL
jgi:pseudouridine-5'-phosphate glycosidase